MTYGQFSKMPCGVIVPIITPLDAAYQVDEPALRGLIGRCLEAGVQAIFAGGSAGFGPLLTDEQWRRLMQIARDEVPRDRLLLGGVIATSTDRALRQIAVLSDLTYDGMAVTPPYYIPLHAEGEFLDYFGACREATDMQMVAYNIPGFTGSAIPLSALRHMVEHGWITAIKESSGDKDYFAAVSDLCRESQTVVTQGHEPDMAWGLSRGAAGVVPVCANYEPTTFVRMVDAARDNDARLLHETQIRANLVRDTLAVGTPSWLAGITYAMSTLGFGTGRPVRPLAALGNLEKQRIDAFEPGTADVTQRAESSQE